MNDGKPVDFLLPTNIIQKNTNHAGKLKLTIKKEAKASFLI